MPMPKPGARRLAAALAAVAGVAFAAAPAAALGLIGDRTVVRVTSAPELASAGIALAAEGTASLDALGRAVLPISGGDVVLPLLEGEVLHDGAGLALAGAGTEVRIDDVRLDLTGLLATARLRVLDGADTLLDEVQPVFELEDCTFVTLTDACRDEEGDLLLEGLGLDLTDTLASVLNQALGTSLPGGAAFGVAFPELRFVPEPGTAALLGLGLAGLAARGRRR